MEAGVEREHPTWLLLDRDDTILDDPGYLSDPDQLKFLPGAIEGLKAFSDAGWQLNVASNQSGVGRGYFDQEALRAVTERFRKILLENGVRIEQVLYCLHAPEQGCDCRKPRPGLALEGQRRWNWPLRQAAVVGDKQSDLEFGRNIGAAYVAQIAAKGQPGLEGADGCFTSLAQLADFLLSSPS